MPCLSHSAMKSQSLEIDANYSKSPFPRFWCKMPLLFHFEQALEAILRGFCCALRGICCALIRWYTQYFRKQAGERFVFDKPEITTHHTILFALKHSRNRIITDLYQDFEHFASVFAYSEMHCVEVSVLNRMKIFFLDSFTCQFMHFWTNQSLSFPTSRRRGSSSVWALRKIIFPSD